HVDTGQPACFYVPMSIDGAEHWPSGDASQFHPRLHIADRARFGIRTVGYPDLAAGAVLVRFRPPQRDRQTVLAESTILNVQPHQFRPAECPRKAEQD